MKKFSVFLPILVASFFLLLPNVRAEEYTYTIPDDVISFTKDNLDYVKNLVENYISSNSNYSSDFIIDYVKGYSSYKYSVFLFYKNWESNRYFNLFYDTMMNGIAFNVQNKCDWFIFSDDFSSFTKKSQCEGIVYQVYDIHYFIYSSFDLFYRNYNNTFIYNFQDTQFTEPISNDLKFSTVYDMYNKFYSEPPDNTPILTNFYSVVGSKVGWLGEQIVSNYIYLSIIGVFILIFLIEFIRRYFL